MSNEERTRDDLLDAEQISHETGVHVKTVRRWMSSGDLRSVRLGRHRLTRRVWFERFFDARAGIDDNGDGDDDY